MRDVTLHWNIGDVVVKLRSLRGMKAGQLAKIAKVKPNTVGTLESGGNSRHETIEKIAVALGVSVEELISLIPSRTESDLPTAVLKSAPGQQPTYVRLEMPLGSPAQSMPSSTDLDGHGGTIQEPQNLAAIARDMRAATTALTNAIEYASTIGGTAMAKRSRQAAAARAARARQRAKSGKNRRKGPGAA